MTTIEHRSVPLFHRTIAMQPTVTSTPQPAATLAPGDLLDERETATRLKLAISTLRNWRAKRIGPPYLKLGARCVRYRLEDLEKFIVQGQRDVGAPE